MKLSQLSKRLSEILEDDGDMDVFLDGELLKHIWFTLGKGLDLSSVGTPFPGNRSKTEGGLLRGGFEVL